MDKKIREIIEKIKDVPGLRIGWVIIDPNIMTVDSGIHELKDAEELMKDHHQREDWIPDRLMPLFWVDKDPEDDKYLPLNSLEAK